MNIWGKNRLAVWGIIMYYLFALPATRFCRADDIQCKTCGVVNTYFVCKIYGIQTPSLCEIRNLVDQAKDGTTSFKGISAGLTKLGLAPRGRRLTFEALCRVRFPAIIHLHTDYGPHFATFGEINGENVIIIDPPFEREMPQKEFLERWSGAALIVMPPEKMRLKNDKDEKVTDIPEKSPLACTRPVVNLGSYVLPLREEPTAEFVIKNISKKTVEIDNIIKSCGCAMVSVSSNTIAPNGVVFLKCSISNAAHEPGNRRHTISIPVKGMTCKPLELEIQVSFKELISVRPLKLYFGRVLRSEMPIIKTLQVIYDPSVASKANMQTVSSSVPWMEGKVDADKVAVAIQPEAAIGPFEENITIDSNIGSINIPVSGECLGSFRIVPNPVILWSSQKYKGEFKIVKTENSDCNLPELLLTYDTDKLKIESRQLKSPPDELNFSISLLDDIKGNNSYRFSIFDPQSEETLSGKIFKFKN